MTCDPLPPVGPPPPPGRCPLCGGLGPQPQRPLAIRFAEDVPPARPAAEQPPHPQNDVSLFDNPVIGGRLTIVVLCYGAFPDLARRCLGSILTTIPPDRVDVWTVANACSEDTLAYLRSLPTTRRFEFPENPKKYPVLRRLLHEADGVSTPYLVWFDDDSYVVRPDWLTSLLTRILEHHDSGGRLYGWTHIHDLKLFMRPDHDPREWFREAPWWRNRPLRSRRAYPAEDPEHGTVIEFVPGGFWAIHVPSAVAADIPDRRLVHNGGDITIGEQIHQAGWRIIPFNRNHEYVRVSGASRRGYSERFPWAGRTTVVL